jgi:hypothetical protein
MLLQKAASGRARKPPAWYAYIAIWVTSEPPALTTPTPEWIVWRIPIDGTELPAELGSDFVV